MAKFKKVLLAYSGGLDTSIIIPWLKEHYDGCEVIAMAADVGQEAELDGLEEKAIATGASKLYIEDLQKEFVEDYICLLYTSSLADSLKRYCHGAFLLNFKFPVGGGLAGVSFRGKLGGRAAGKAHLKGFFEGLEFL